MSEPSSSATDSPTRPNADPSPDSSGAGGPRAPVPVLTPYALFIAFSQMALSGFGGVMPFAYRTLVERRRWVSAQEFAAMLALGQTLPGPTICNVSLMIGWRFAGIAGALAALAGMLAGPIALVLALGALYQRFGDIAAVHRALIGMGAVAAGLLISTAVKMGMSVFAKRGQRSWDILSIAAALCAFAGVGAWRLPLVAVVLVLAPLTIFFAWKLKR